MTRSLINRAATPQGLLLVLAILAAIFMIVAVAQFVGQPSHSAAPATSPQAAGRYVPGNHI